MNDVFDHSHETEQADPLAWSNADTVGAAVGFFIFLVGLVLGYAARGCK